MMTIQVAPSTGTETLGMNSFDRRPSVRSTWTSDLKRDEDNSGEPQMLYEEYKHWYDIIRQDDLQGARDALDKAGGNERLGLLNSKFVFKEIDCKELGIKKKEKASVLLFSKATSIAIFHRSRKVLKLLTENGVDYLSSDVCGNNVFHVIATAGKSFPEHEEEFAEMYENMVDRIGDLDLVKKLLHQENGAGLRPLELAAQYDVYALMLAIFETEGVYKFSTYGMLPMALVRYDMREYERYGASGRRAKSPIRFLIYLTQDDMKKKGCCRLFQHPLMRQWVRRKYFANLVFGILWFVIRTMFLVSFADSGFEKYIFKYKEAYINATCPAKVSTIKTSLANGSAISQSGFTTYYLLIYSFLALIVDLIEFIGALTFRKMPQKKAAWRFWQRCSMNSYSRLGVGFASIFAIVNLFVMNLGMIELPQWIAQEMATNGTMMYIFGLMLLIWSHLLFLQLLPTIGEFLIGFQWMLMAFYSFFIVFFYIFGTLSIAFQKIYLLSCIDDSFASGAHSLYSTFLVMLNMKPFTIVEADVAILHVVYVFIIALLLLNFLIAILTDTQATVTKHMVIIESVQILDLVFAIEDRIGWLYNKIWNREETFLFKMKQGLILK